MSHKPKTQAIESKDQSGNTQVPRPVTDDTDAKYFNRNDQLQNWLIELYQDDIDESELNEYYQAFKYQGFDRESILSELMRIVNGSKRTAIQLILLCALRGPKAASTMKLMNGSSPAELNIPASGMKGTKRISCSRITAATADLAAFYLKKLNIPKKFHDDPLPAWLQFPAAGAILLSNELRQLHLNFTKRFSLVIGGEFNDSIYNQMVSNAYLNDQLNLFD
jgi:hypothetical protein